MLGVMSSRGKGAPSTQIDRVMSAGFSLRKELLPRLTHKHPVGGAPFVVLCDPVIPGARHTVAYEYMVMEGAPRSGRAGLGR